MAKTGDVESPTKVNALKQTGSSRYELYNESKEQTVKVEALHTGLVTEQDQEQNQSIDNKKSQALSAFQKKIIDEPSDDEYSDDSDQKSNKESPGRKPFDLGAEEEDDNGSEDKDEDEEYSDDNDNDIAFDPNYKPNDNNANIELQNHVKKLVNVQQRGNANQADENEKELTTSEQDYSNDDDFDETDNKTTS